MMKYWIGCLVLFFSACAYAQNPNIQLQPIATGVSSPVLVTNAGDGSNRLFIVEQTGKIRVMQPEATTATDFLNLTTKLVSGGEQGLLGLAFHPKYKTNRKFYVNYTRSGDGATVVSEFQSSASNRNLADTTERILLTIAQPYANHNGGMIAFGPDGYLYIGMGDGGSGNDPGNRAQNIENLLGKMLRIDVNRTEGALQYGIPPDNPFVGTIAGRDEIFAVGVRNPWRWSFDRSSGQLYVADVGQNAREWVHIVEKGKNYGWATWEGTRCNTSKPVGSPECTALPLISPLLEYAHSAGRCSITGGYVYRGARFTFAQGAYIYGDYCTGEIWQFANGQSLLLQDTTLSLSAFGEDEGGEIYVCGLNNGTVYRLTNTTSPRTIGTVSSASYDKEASVARESIASAFGTGLANGEFSAPNLPLPTNLGGTTVTIRDSQGIERLAPLFYAGPMQVNFQIPAQTATGYSAVFVKLNDVVVSSGPLKVDGFAPGIFTAAASGAGVAAGRVQRVRNGISTYEEMVERDPADSTKWRSVAIDLEPATDGVFLLLFGTGLRGRTEPLNASVNIGGMSFPLDFVGAQSEFVGLDQINIRLSQTLQGKGEVDVVVTIDGQALNTVRARFK
ncbi:MAG: PQQ-dependent sugar dehydrogenase [Acidobacteria bacterium]|nr:PQQ-dependent sugar dehydrogenase [Acidobacteriota bacterium]